MHLEDATRDSSLGIYVHIPYCIRKCTYCDFYSLPIQQESTDYLENVRREAHWANTRYQLGDRQVVSIYFGGGTPTCLPTGDLIRTLDELRAVFTVSRDAEITIEANPGTVQGEDLYLLRQAGWNRLSLGIQAFQDHLLAAVGRIHSRNQAEQAYRIARRMGFQNISIDVIFGLPGQSFRDWEETLSTVSEWAPEHLSAYWLTIEEGTPLAQQIDSGVLDLPGEETELAMYRYLLRWARENHFERYEISNFSRFGCESQHNLRYWRRQEYLGLGAAAHSLLGGCRLANVADLPLYEQRVSAGRKGGDSVETLSAAAQISEALFLGLRLANGVDLVELSERYGLDLQFQLRPLIDELVQKGWVSHQDRRIAVTEEALPISNQVFQRFLLSDYDLGLDMRALK